MLAIWIVQAALQAPVTPVGEFESLQWNKSTTGYIMSPGWRSLLKTSLAAA